MSNLRPSDIDDEDMSFEDMDTTQDAGRTVQAKRDSNSVLSDEREEIRGSSSPLGKGSHDPPVPSTISSPASTTFSGKDNHRYSTYTESEDGEFLGDFEELNNTDRVDDWLHFKGDMRAEAYKENDDEDELIELQEQLEQRLKFFSEDTREKDAAKIFADHIPTLKNAPNLQNISTRNKPAKATVKKEVRYQIPLSRSHANLRQSISSRTGLDSRIRNKKSMPIIPRFGDDPMMSEEREDLARETGQNRDRDDFWDGKVSLKPTYYFPENDENEDDFELPFHGDDAKLSLNNFKAVYMDAGSDDDPLNLAPTQYNIIQDDALLTPQLHKYSRKTTKNLDDFREKDHRRHRKMHSRGSVNYRLRTIKQEIDHNTPMKAGSMSYNPKLKKWEGNEEILERFKAIDSLDTHKALLITKKDSLRSSPSRKATSMNSNGSNNGKLVGKMMFDEENLRWYNIEGREIDPFGGIDVTIKAKPIPQATSASLKTVNFQRTQSQPSNPHLNLYAGRAPSTRFHSLGNGLNSNPIFNISGKQLEKFYHEENRWARKIGGWFSSDSREFGNDLSYMYEIRNMVMNSARN
ncbi:HFL260Wp [Eremothecium sinecaudum]|uniref:HFL260Wp n=1 Tax=Eremothecium sinecaudum TaxID=45286 RepID=A0A0X8HTL8_9SACH|nr:HFL260Wp [Eremothecium sinecaudum]AMD21596.1 HFL260Wp [Eremothecium sinecaudum]